MVNRYRIHGFDTMGNFDPYIEINADYYKIEDGYLNLYLKVAELNVVRHTKTASFNKWSYIKRFPIE